MRMSIHSIGHLLSRTHGKPLSRLTERQVIEPTRNRWRHGERTHDVHPRRGAGDTSPSTAQTMSATEAKPVLTPFTAIQVIALLLTGVAHTTNTPTRKRLHTMVLSPFTNLPEP